MSFFYIKKANLLLSQEFRLTSLFTGSLILTGFIVVKTVTGRIAVAIRAIAVTTGVIAIATGIVAVSAGAVTIGAIAVTTSTGRTVTKVAGAVVIKTTARAVTVATGTIAIAAGTVVIETTSKARGTLLLLLIVRFFYTDQFAIHFYAIQQGNGLFCFYCIRHIDKAEAFTFSCIAVFD